MKPSLLRRMALRLDTLMTPGRGRLGDENRRGVRTVRTSGGDVRFRHQPSSRGPRLLVGADGPNTLDHYDGLLHHLAGKADVVVFDPPGTGGSAPAPHFDFQVASFARVAEELLAELGPRTLQFPCYLGLAAQRVARRSPHLAPRLVLPQTASGDDFLAWAEKVDPRRLLRTPFVGQALVAARRRTIARGWYRASVGHRACRAPFVADAEAAFDAGGCFCLASLMQGFEVDLGAGAAIAEGPLPVPVAVVWGAKDRTHAASDPARSVPGAEVVRFEASGHCPDLEEPARFADWLLRWHAES